MMQLKNNSNGPIGVNENRLIKQFNKPKSYTLEIEDDLRGRRIKKYQL